jgi:hypothetical protein
MMILSGSFSFIDFLVNTVLPINQSTSFSEPNIPLFHCSLAQTWHARPELHRLCFGNITAKTTYSRQLAPGQANIPVVPARHRSRSGEAGGSEAN